MLIVFKSLKFKSREVLENVFEELISRSLAGLISNFAIKNPFFIWWSCCIDSPISGCISLGCTYWVCRRGVADCCGLLVEAYRWMSFNDLQVEQKRLNNARPFGRLSFQWNYNEIKQILIFAFKCCFNWIIFLTRIFSKTFSTNKVQITFLKSGSCLELNGNHFKAGLFL